jgi:taurine dioxygenase
VTIEVEASGCALGATVRGVDLARLDNVDFDALRAALYEHSVLWVKDQAHLTDDDQLSFARRFGPIFRHPAMAAFGIDDIRVEVIEDNPDSPPAADKWHTDVTYSPNPPSVAILRAEIVPETGGDTLWTSQIKAYAALSEPVRRMIDGLVVQHWPASFIEGVRSKAGSRVANKMHDVLPSAQHPLVITHPVTGDLALYANRDFCRAILGLSYVESDRILDLVCEHATLPTYSVRHRWEHGDVAIWDEYATQHYAVGDHFPQRRRMRRITVEGIAPPSRVTET